MKFVEQGPDSGHLSHGRLRAGYARQGNRIVWYVNAGSTIDARGASPTVDDAKTAIIANMLGKRKNKRKARRGNKEPLQHKPAVQFVNLGKGNDSSKGKGKEDGRNLARALQRD